MKTIKFTTKTGKTRFKFEMSEQEYTASRNEYQGLCIACGEDAYECEPDARQYKCEACGERCVYGTEELIMMDWIDIRG